MHSNLEDKILIQGLAEGNTRIFDYIFLHYYSVLVAYVTKQGITNADAEDIVQDFFIKLWINRSSLTIAESLKNYLFTSIKNKCYDYFRHERVEERAKEIMLLDSENEVFTDRDHMAESDLRELINMAIGKLPDKCRKVFIMNRFKHMKPAEIAEVEGVSVRTVEGHIGKAYKLLRKELKPYLPATLITLLLT